MPDGTPRQPYVQAVALAHWGRANMAAISQTTLSNAFSWKENVIISIKISLKFVPKGPINNILSIGSDNGLAPARRQAIIWTNDGKFTDA